MKHFKDVLYMKLLKIQDRERDTIVSIPAEMRRTLGNAEYLKCSIDEHGIHYVPVEV